jgi:predicted GNAT family N-acyltransferase
MVGNKGKVQIREIDYHSDEYNEELELRDKVLRKPLGMSLFVENLDKEKYDVHLGAFINKRMVGVLILTELTGSEVKMRQVAVEEEVRGNNIGKELVRYAEEFCKNKGYTLMVLNARKTAVGFYEKLGYDRLGEEFLEINIPHNKMHKHLSQEQSTI